MAGFSRRRRDQGFRLMGGLLTVTIGASLLLAGSAPAGHAALRSSESEQARRSGRPVEIRSLRSESREVYAQPNGTFEAIQHLRPVRVRQGGRWVGIDTRLVRRADGTVGPVASTVGLAFSGGGTAPMATMTQAGRRLAFSWPNALPTPVLNGPDATYKDVIAGVDLRLHANADGFSHVLIVRTREASADEKLARLTFAMTERGLNLTKDAAGGLMATGGRGPVFAAPRPLMWDSAGKSTAAGPAYGSHRAAVGVRVDAHAVTLKPDRAMLTDPATVFPVYIDPIYQTVLDEHRLMVSSDGSTAYDFTGDEGMGRCIEDIVDCGPSHVNRLLYAMPTDAYAGATVISAEFQLRETFAPTCTAGTVELWQTRDFDASSTWDSTSDGWLTKLDAKDAVKGGPGCPAGDLIFNATSAMQETAAAGSPTLTLGLRAQDELDPLAWKRFSDHAYLRVYYDNPPSQPSGADLTSSPGGACAGPDAPALVATVPTVSARLSDPDLEKISGEFRAVWDDASGHHEWDSPPFGPKSSGSTFSTPLPSSLPQQVTIQWSARAYDGTTYGPWNDATGCYLFYDNSAT